MVESTTPQQHREFPNARNDIVTALTGNQLDFMSVLSQYHDASKTPMTPQSHVLNQTKINNRSLIFETTAANNMGKINVVVKEDGKMIFGVERAFIRDREISIITLHGGKIRYGMTGEILPESRYDDHQLPRKANFADARSNLATRLSAISELTRFQFDDEPLVITDEMQRAALPTKNVVNLAEKGSETVTYYYGDTTVIVPQGSVITNNKDGTITAATLSGKVERITTGEPVEKKQARTTHLGNVTGLAIGEGAQGPQVINKPGRYNIEDATGVAIGDNAKVDPDKKSVSIQGDVVGRVIDLGRGNVISGTSGVPSGKDKGKKPPKYNIGLNRSEGNLIITGNKNVPPGTPAIPAEILKQHPQAIMIKTRGDNSVTMAGMGKDRFELHSTSINGVLFDGVYVKVGSEGDYDIVALESEEKK